jgi:hypothetical protein
MWNRAEIMLSALELDQRTLNGNGYRLCPTRKRLDVQGADGIFYRGRSFAARFVTRDDDLIFDTLVNSQLDSLKNAANRKGDLMRFIQETHPQLGEASAQAHRRARSRYARRFGTATAPEGA